jgi:hypothetical protein
VAAPLQHQEALTEHIIALARHYGRYDHHRVTTLRHLEHTGHGDIEIMLERRCRHSLIAA